MKPKICWTWIVYRDEEIFVWVDVYNVHRRMHGILSFHIIFHIPDEIKLLFHTNVMYEGNSHNFNMIPVQCRRVISSTLFKCNLNAYIDKCYDTISKYKIPARLSSSKSMKKIKQKCFQNMLCKYFILTRIVKKEDVINLWNTCIFKISEVRDFCRDWL